MGFYIRETHTKKWPRWKVQFVSYKKSDTTGSRAEKPKKSWDIPKERWRSLGFHGRLTAADARARAKQLNNLRLLQNQEKRLRKLRLEEKAMRIRYRGFLPPEFTDEFEKRFLRKRDRQTTDGRRRLTRAHVLWRAVQKLIVQIQIEPSEWYGEQLRIYDYLYENQLSPSYGSKIISMLNLWGAFICRKLDQPFTPICKPRGFEKQRIVDQYYGTKETCGSRPLRPETLEAARGMISAMQFNWLFVSVWLGLRPREIDNTKQADLWRVDDHSSGQKVLWLYQTKLTTLPYVDRWKPIPIVCKEQESALDIIKSQSLERPILKTVRRHLGSDVSLYGGRKGFTDLMLEKGHSLESVSMWLGHSTIARTWRTYKNRLGFVFSLRHSEPNQPQNK